MKNTEKLRDITKRLSAEALWDSANGIKCESDVLDVKIFEDGRYTDRAAFTEENDVKIELYGANAVRLLNVSAGFAYTLPCTELSVDYTIAKYRTQVTFGGSILTASFESSNPYLDRSDPWYIYCYEWLIMHINSDDFMKNNKLRRLNGTKPYAFTKEHPFGDLTVKKGYDVYRYDVLIEDADLIERPYYNIAIIREISDSKNFAMFVMKSDCDMAAVMDNIVQSYTRLPARGVQKNYFTAEPKENPTWSEETRNYFRRLCNAETVHWGVFSYSMPGLLNELRPGDEGYDLYIGKSQRMQSEIERLWNYKYDIYPTYTHIGKGTDADDFTGHYFPLEMARALAGGNGVNGKPVLQFTYQFTLDNNIVAGNRTPMFDILRGKYEAHFRRLARDIKEYGYPVLFRLNNEMNTDWTSYCGMMTLLDPDIFLMTWRYLYDIFTEEGVDNAIWIWNPIARSCPYSSWGEDLCYFPGVEYAQLLGGTSYEMNNYTKEEAAEKIISFQTHYSVLYEKNKISFPRWYMVLSEFACGSGGNCSGELGRNGDVQARWVDDMFGCLNAEKPVDWVKQIKGAVWFNCNDSNDGLVLNRLRFCDPDNQDCADLAATTEAFRKGFAARK